MTAAADAGMARERTSLAWTRTSLALLANGLLVVVRHENDFPWAVSAALSTLALAVAALALSHAVRRSRAMRHPGAGCAGAPTNHGPATVAVLSLGLGVALMCAATAVAIAVTTTR